MSLSENGLHKENNGLQRIFGTLGIIIHIQYCLVKVACKEHIQQVPLNDCTAYHSAGKLEPKRQKHVRAGGSSS